VRNHVAAFSDSSSKKEMDVLTKQLISTQNILIKEVNPALAQAQV
jgi:hypothetical protein